MLNEENSNKEQQDTTSGSKKAKQKLTTGQVLPLLIDVMLGQKTMEVVSSLTSKTVDELKGIYMQHLVKLSVELGSLQTKVEAVSGYVKEGIEDSQAAKVVLKSAEKRLNEISERLLVMSKT